MEYNYFVDLSSPFIIVYLIMVTLGTSINSVIDWMNTRKDNVKEKVREVHSLGDEAKKLFSMPKINKALKYDSEWTNFSDMREGISSSIASVCTLLGVIPFMIQLFIRVFPGLSVVWSAIFTSITLMTVSTLTEIPFDVYSTFKLDGKYGFNNMTAKTFVGDMVKSVAIAVVSIVVVKHILNFGLVKFGNMSVRNIILFSIGLVLGMKAIEYIQANVIMPMFNKFYPVPKKSLSDKIMKLCRESGFKVKKIMVMDESKRSKHTNAFIYGTFRKKIVLFDTLLKDFSDDEILAIVAHEIGHGKKHHLLYGDLMSIASSFLTTVMLFLLINRVGMYHAFGYSWVTPENIRENLIVGFPVALGLISACSWFVSPLMYTLSRKMEYQADEFATKMVGKQAMRSTMLKLCSQNLSDPFPDKTYETCNYTHPSLLNRVAAINAVPDELCPKPKRKTVKKPTKKNKAPKAKPAAKNNGKKGKDGKKKAE